jgi:hypothetical protein
LGCSAIVPRRHPERMTSYSCARNYWRGETLAAHYLKKEVERLTFGPPIPLPRSVLPDPTPLAAQAATSPPHVPQEPRTLHLAGGAPESPLPADTRLPARKVAPFTTRLLAGVGKAHAAPIVRVAVVHLASWWVK